MQTPWLSFSLLSLSVRPPFVVPADIKAELIKLNKGLLFLFLELLTVLVQQPSGYSSALTPVMVTLHNMMHLINLARHHQVGTAADSWPDSWAGSMLTWCAWCKREIWEEGWAAFRRQQHSAALQRRKQLAHMTVLCRYHQVEAAADSRPDIRQQPSAVLQH